MSYSSDIIEAVLNGKVKDRDSLQRLKVDLCKKYSLSRTPSNSEILAEVPKDMRSKVEPLLRLKPIRSLSGVAVVAVMASPASCPHGKCIYCPGGPEKGTAQSYTGYEPAARRAADNEFDPFRQVECRLKQLIASGHPVDKIDLIVMGGTFPAREINYQQYFILRCFDAMNGTESTSINEAHKMNESAPSRCVGLTIETRPDQFDQKQIEFLTNLGMTRVELGVQTVFEDCLANLNRGHTIFDTVMATQRAKRNGLKVGYHMMPGLPGSNLEKDVENFRTIFEGPRFRPDMLKIYPTLVIKGTKLYDMWSKGEYEPPDTNYIVDLLVKVKQFVPEWVRIQRIQRDIPIPQIEAGARQSHTRQLIAQQLKEKGAKCRCIRCREIGHTLLEEIPDKLEFKQLEYSASNGTEHFIEIQDPASDALIGFTRLRIDDDISGLVATVRELRIYGQQVPIDDHIPKAMQHKGYGKQLLERCEEIAKDEGVNKLRVTSGVGARGYYRRLGYESDGFYMSKNLPSR